MNRGILYAVSAYFIWGFIPIYIKLLGNVPAAQLLSHRIIWSSLCLFIIILFTRKLGLFRKAVFDRHVIGI
ncbi:MAG: EamA family transporter, partial [Deltaproteobacteria bacterium]